MQPECDGPTALPFTSGSMPSPVDVVDAVGQAIATLSPSGPPRLETVARSLGTGVRTLQRRLAKTGTSYERLLARARLGTAARLLASTDASVLEIALDVGYSDHAHFTRAFRKWTGVPPRQFRKDRAASSRTRSLS